MGRKHNPITRDYWRGLSRGSKEHKETTKSDNCVKWERAAESEIDSLKDNDTWEMALRTDEMRPLHTNLVFETGTDLTDTSNGLGKYGGVRERAFIWTKLQADVRRHHGHDDW